MPCLRTKKITKTNFKELKRTKTFQEDMIKTYSKIKKNHEELTKNFTSLHLLLFFFSYCFICIRHEYFDSFSSFRFFSFPLSSSFILRTVFNHQKRCSSTNWSVFIWENLTSFFNKRHRKGDDMTAIRRRKLNFNWWLVWVLCLLSGMDFQNVVALGNT